MEEFNRPLKKVEKQKKKKFAKEVFIIILIVVCLGLGFIAGYFSKKSHVITQSEEETVLDEVYTTLKDNWVNTSDEDIDIETAGITGFISGLGDPHASYWTSDQAVDYNQTVSGNYQGIGVGFMMVSSGAMITKVYDHSPAQEEGLEVGDIIINADGHDLAGQNSDTVVSYVRGQENTNVQLTLLRGKEEFSKKIERRSLDTSTFYEIRKNNGMQFGYIELSTFGTDTANQVEAALKEFKENGIETLVLDLRDNGGGYLTAATDILDLFFSKDDVIYQMQEKNKAVQKFYAASDEKYTFKNGYILINGNTASASELTAGALQSELGYKLIGTQTYGKGSAQTQKTLSNGSVLKYTYAKWMIPDGTCIDGKGLTPDVEVENITLDGISSDEVEGTLRYDCVNECVKDMQKMLKLLGYPVDREDGYFSSQSVEALKAFESDNGLDVNGEYDENDRMLLIAKMMIAINNHENDHQYQKLLEMME